MSGVRRDIDYLQDLLEAIRRTQEYTDSMTWQEFVTDKKLKML